MSDDTDPVADEASLDDPAERDDLADEAEAADEADLLDLEEAKAKTTAPKRRSSKAAGSPGHVCWLRDCRYWR